jgi:hypothetical protein
MTPDPGKQKVDVAPKAPEAAKPAEAPKGVDAAKETAKADNTGARHDLSDETAQETVAGEYPLDALAKSLPQNKWTEMYFQLVEQVKLHPELNGQFTHAALAMLLWAAKYAHYADMIPGAFTASLDTEENLKGEKLAGKEIETAISKKKEDPQEALTDEQKNAFKASGIEKASAKYVAGKLFGMTDVDSPQLLSAKIIHVTKTVTETKEETKDGETENVTVESEIPYYKSVNLEFLKKNGMPFGTVIVFTPDPETGAKVTAYATGNGDEVEFIDANGEIKRANLSLNDQVSTLIPSQFRFQAAFVPLFNSDPQYFAEHPKDFDARLTEPAKAVEVPAPPGEAVRPAETAESARDRRTIEGVKSEVAKLAEPAPKTSEPLKNFNEEIAKNFPELANLLNFEGEVFESWAACNFTETEGLIYPKILDIVDNRLSAIGNSVDFEKLAGFMSNLTETTIKIHELVQFIAETYTAYMLQSVDGSFREKYPLVEALPNKDKYQIKYKVTVVDGGDSFITEFRVGDVFVADYKRLEGDGGIRIDVASKT